MYEPFEKVAREHHKCPCCDRGFTPDEEDQFVKKVGDEIILDYSFCQTVKCFTCQLILLSLHLSKGARAQLLKRELKCWLLNPQMLKTLSSS
jgi:hypothetical protein